MSSVTYKSELHIKYTENKQNYRQLQQLVNELKGGAKVRPKELKTMKLPCAMTTYMLTRGMFSSFDDVKLSDLVGSIGKITKIGSFEVKDKVVIGDTDYNPIDLAPGTYKAYFLADSLMIIHDKLKIVPKASDVKDWKWTHSGSGVGVDGGVYGFYDLHAIDFINKKMNDKNYNNLPFINCDKMFKGDKVDAFIVDGSCVEELGSKKKKIDKEITDLKPFGVIATTVTGDGGFECFVIDNMRAILFGGEANNVLFNDEDEENSE